MKRLLFVACVLASVTSGCAGSLEEAKLAGRAYRPLVAKTGTTPDGVDCVSIDRAHIVWDGTAKVAAFLASGEGIAMIPIHDEGARVGLAVGVIGAGAVAILAESFSVGLATEWAKYCADNGAK